MPRRRGSRRQGFTYRAMDDLKFGPWGLTEEGESDWPARAREGEITGFIGAAVDTDEEAERAFRMLTRDVDEDWWAYWRFERGLGSREAFSALWARRKRRQAKTYRAFVAKSEQPEWWYIRRQAEKADKLECEAKELESVVPGAPMSRTAV
jgi:hypothetical protein